MMNKNNKQFLIDLLAFVRFIHNNPNMDLQRKYSAIVSTIGHDINGILAEDKFFSPRVTGYSNSDLI
jgi:hypothetical protein